MSLFLIPALPLAAALLSLLPWGRRTAPLVTLAATGVSLALAVSVALLVVSTGALVALPGWVAVDGFAALLTALVAFLNFTAALFSWGYVAHHDYTPARARSYWAHFNLFAFSLVLVPVLDQPALVWIAVEFTAVFSVLLVAFENTHDALEAAWKYIALMFMGAAIALVGFFLLFWAQDAAGGGHYSWEGLRAVAGRLPPPLALAAFLFVLVGFGVKVGLVPLHTWLPDAHSQAPAPVCALLSGIKTTNSLYVIFRLGALLPPSQERPILQVVGLVAVVVAAFLLLQVTDYKRLFAYSTVEHMGILCVAAGLGGDGAFGAMMQMVAHSLTKSFCFLAAGAALLVVGTREIATVRGLIHRSPAAGVALIGGALAIGGAPPFAVFLSEFSIFRAGLAQGAYLVTGLLAAGIVVAFFGILLHVNRVVFGAPSPPPDPARHRGLPAACTAALALAAIPVIVLGICQPAPLAALLSQAAAAIAPVGGP